MIRASSSTIIPRTPDQVFDFIADLGRNYRRWSPEVIDLQIHTSGPLRVGTTARQVRVDKGRRTETTFRVSALERGRRMDFQGTSDPFRLSYELAEAGGHTRLTFTFELTRIELFMRPFEKLIRLAVQDGTRRTVRNIRGLVEREVPAEPPSRQHYPE